MSVPAEQDEQSDKIVQPPPRYGESLSNGRKRFGYSIERISEELNISVDIIEKIDGSAIADLPPTTFMQGYIKAYAKLVEVDAQQALRDYATAVPDPSRPLRARSNLPREADSHSPLVSITTRLIMICAVLAAIYGIYTYYSDKMQSYETASKSEQIALPEDTGIRVQLAEQTQPEPDEVVMAPLEVMEAPVSDAQSDLVDAVVPISAPEMEAPIVQETLQQQPQSYNFVLYADQDSWVEVTGADNERLHYNLLKAGEEISLIGAAPFTVFLGNAPQMTMSLNGLDVRVENFIRGNNTAQFRVSMEDGDVVFLRR